jgi:hypothetical protein
MMNLSSHLPSLLCTIVFLLGWLRPVIGAADTQTSKVFKVLTKKDGMGGECNDRLAQVSALIPEVRALVDASINAIGTIIEAPSPMVLFSTNGKWADRERILLLARKFLGVEFGGKRRDPSRF